MAIVSNSVVVIELVDGKKLVNDETVGMNMDEVGIKGCIACEGSIAVYHRSGGYTLVSERDIASINTISETINWSKELEWIDTKDGEPSDYFMQTVPGEASFSQIQDYYENGFFLRHISTKQPLTIETIRSYFRFVKEGEKQTA